MKWSMLSLATAAILLLLADALAFHDLIEPHTVRDWMMLVASVLVLAGAGRHVYEPPRDVARRR